MDVTMTLFRLFAAAVCLLIAFYYKGRLDKSSDGKFILLSKNKANTDENKYAFPLTPYTPVWYYFSLFKPAYKEIFPFSSTALAFLTDYWHWTQFRYLQGMFVAISLGMAYNLKSFLIIYLIIHLLYAIGFNYGYERK